MTQQALQDQELLDRLHSRPPVHSRPIARPVESAPRRGKSAAVALFALALALPAWMEGARTTREGWVLFINWVLARAHLPLAVPPSSAWHWGVALGALVLLGWGYSRVEINHAPIRPPRNWRKDFFNGSAWHIETAWQRWLVWLALIVSDVGTMYLGARQPQASDPAIFHQIAASWQVASAYAILITFVPDQLLRYGWRSLRG